MTRKEFQVLMDKHYQEIRGINDVKGHDYAGDKDALSNFKKHADELGRSVVARLGPRTRPRLLRQSPL